MIVKYLKTNPFSYIVHQSIKNDLLKLKGEIPIVINEYKN